MKLTVNDRSWRYRSLFVCALSAVLMAMTLGPAARSAHWGDTAAFIDVSYQMTADGIMLFEEIDQDMGPAFIAVGDAAMAAPSASQLIEQPMYMTGVVDVEPDMDGMSYPTVTPEPTVEPSPTPTYWATPSAVPEPTGTPLPPCERNGVALSMPSANFGPGDTCWVKADVCNNGDAPITNARVFIILDIGTDEYWFAPSWAYYPPDIDNYAFDLMPGLLTIDAVTEFVWPLNAGDHGPYWFWGAITDSDVSAVIGHIGQLEFRYHS